MRRFCAHGLQAASGEMPVGSLSGIQEAELMKELASYKRTVEEMLPGVKEVPGTPGEPCKLVVHSGRRSQI